MRCYNLDGCQAGDQADARKVAARLDIPFYVFDFEDEYKRRVVDYMVRGYAKGETPNPDVMCNKEIKFGLFWARARSLGADFMATGHYVRKTESRIKNPASARAPADRQELKNSALCRARDESKDQSYFLWTLKQSDLRHCLFPVGDYLKSEVREVARRAGLPTADKKDSQGICFLGKFSLADFLRERIPARAGDVLDETGRVIGQHDGVQFYTIGQRHIRIRNQELGIRGRGDVRPHYIAEKDLRNNTIMVVEGAGNPKLYALEFTLREVSFISPALRECRNRRVYVSVRYRIEPQPAKIMNAGGRKWRVRFEKPQKAVAVGQSAVFYSESGEILGGGVVNRIKN